MAATCKSLRIRVWRMEPVKDSGVKMAWSLYATFTFHGVTQEEAQKREREHRLADRFYAAAVEGKSFDGVRLTARRAWIC